jgi:hypothetical protein
VGRSDRWSRGAQREPSPPEAVSPLSSLPLPEPSRMCSNPLWACFVTEARLIWGGASIGSPGFHERVGSAVAALRFGSRKGSRGWNGCATLRSPILLRPCLISIWALASCVHPLLFGSPLRGFGVGFQIRRSLLRRTGAGILQRFPFL